MKPFYLYILKCRDGSYYVGHTDDLEKRMGEHDDGLSDGYTARRRPVELVFVDEFSTREETIERERQLKGWSRAKKEALIRRDWDELQRLARRYGKRRAR
jgi:predicted GIY-YIG superfamily endonuclease